MTDRSAEELEREAERIRSGIASTTDELKARMSPGQMVDELTSYLRDSDGGYAIDRLRHQVRENPMALALVGTGLAWLMLGGRSSSSSDYDRDYGEVPRIPDASYGTRGSSYGSSGSSYGAFGGDRTQSGSASSYTPAPGSSYGASDTSSTYSTGGSAGAYESSDESSGGSSIRERVGGVASAVGEAASKVGEYARSAGGTVRSYSHDARDRVSGMGQGAWESGRSFAGGSRRAIGGGTRSFMDALDREPLITGAIGLAVGAAIGAMLPKSRYEEEALGPQRERLMRGAGEAFEQAREKATHIAEDAYAAARRAAEEEGLVPSGDKPLAEKLGTVAKAAASTATSEGKDEAERTAGSTGSMGGSSSSGSSTTGSSASGSSMGGSSAAGSSGSVAADTARTGSTTGGGGLSGAAVAGSGSGASPGSASGMSSSPKTGTDDLASRSSTGKRDVGPGGTGPG